MKSCKSEAIKKMQDVKRPGGAKINKKYLGNAEGNRLVIQREGKGRKEKYPTGNIKD
jgi:hypothetical protein